MLAKEFEIGHCAIGGSNRCFVIAEAGIAHFGDINKAFQLVDMAADSGADALKFQMFNVDEMISKESEDWKSRLRSRSLNYSEYSTIKEYCCEKSIQFFGTAHDEQGLDTLVKLDVPAYKIGSGEYRNWPFLKKVAGLGKPIIFSTGMYELHDVDQALDIFLTSGNNEIGLLHCVTLYPTQPSYVNLRVVDLYRQRFGGVIGYSDHTEGMHIPLAAVALGIDIVEKHISLDFNVPDAQDWKVSCGPHNLNQFVQQLREIELALGHPKKIVGEEEKASRLWACKSLVVAHDLRRGDIIVEVALKAKRPGTGILASEEKMVLGKKLKVDISKDSVLQWAYLE